jgi:hypothetical protein
VSNGLSDRPPFAGEVDWEVAPLLLTMVKWGSNPSPRCAEVYAYECFW